MKRNREKGEGGSMALFDKLGDLTKNVGEKATEFTRNLGDRTSDIVENNRAALRINTEKKRIAEYKSRIGDLYYKKYLRGSIADTDADEFCALIREAERTIAGLEAEIENRKADKEARKDTAREEAAERREKRRSSYTGRCPKCGLMLEEGTDICPRCGVAEEKEDVTETEFCPICGTVVAGTGKFCPECGTPRAAQANKEEIPLEEEVPQAQEIEEAPEEEGPGQVCSVCGTESSVKEIFCPNCGTKLG